MQQKMLLQLLLVSANMSCDQSVVLIIAVVISQDKEFNYQPKDGYKAQYSEYFICDRKVNEPFTVYVLGARSLLPSTLSGKKESTVLWA